MKQTQDLRGILHIFNNPEQFSNFHTLLYVLKREGIEIIFNKHLCCNGNEPIKKETIDIFFNKNLCCNDNKPLKRETIEILFNNFFFCNGNKP